MLDTKGKLYKITFPQGSEAIYDVAVGVEFRDSEKFKGMCYLTPPDRGHMIRGEFKEGNSEAFVFTSTEVFQGDWVLNRITKDNFVTECRGLIVGCSAIDDKCETTEELEEWFYSRFLPNGG